MLSSVFRSSSRSLRSVNSIVQMRSLVTGTVKFFNKEKGYGFISKDDGSGDVFVHFSAINSPAGEFRDLSDGQRVSFDVGMDPRTGKPRASNVSKIEGNQADDGAH
eukprot:TRINITY_DN158_c0_g1_i1.p1 TRINITY_DN158_c0_g1~~TRINITY_DN158_c0_g1_i1.p1  ORF type:complete len:106 (-),score=33.93 TRINITY_DN158_c0_g1_i1:119-436(-)